VFVNKVPRKTSGPKKHEVGKLEYFKKEEFFLEVFWAVTSCSDVAGYHRVKMKVVSSFYLITTRYHNPEDHGLLSDVGT